MGHDSKTRLVTALVIAAVFGSGVLIGFAADGGVGQGTAVAAEAPTDSTTEAPNRRRPMYSRVEPSEAQQTLIDSIVRVHRKRTNELDEERRAAFRQIVLETREEIKSVLSEEQAAEYQRLLDEWDARQAAERENDPD